MSHWQKVDIDDYSLRISDKVTLCAYCPREGAKWKWDVHGLDARLSGRCDTEQEAKDEAIHRALHEARYQRNTLDTLIDRLGQIAEG